jgi:transcription elongation factor Elf1
MQFDVHGKFKPSRDRSRAPISRTIAQMRQAHSCPQCGDLLVLPEWSEWLDAGHVRHLWQCDACGYAFETRVEFAAA